MSIVLRDVGPSGMFAVSVAFTSVLWSEYVNLEG